MFEIFPCSRQSLFHVLTQLLLLPRRDDPVHHHHQQTNEDEGDSYTKQLAPISLTKEQ